MENLEVIMTAERRRMSRARILAGAFDILDAGVYSDLTVDALARALHMSKSTLYKYFSSKDDVVIALIDEACATTDAELAALEMAGSRATLEAMVEVLAHHADRVPQAAVLHPHRLPIPCQDRLDRTRRSVHRSAREAMRRALAAGHVHVNHRNLAADGLVAASLAAMVTAAEEGFEGGRGDAVRAMFRMMQPGLMAARASRATG